MRNMAVHWAALRQRQPYSVAMQPIVRRAMWQMDGQAPILVTGANGRLGSLLRQAATRLGLLDRFIWQSRTRPAQCVENWYIDDLKDPKSLFDRTGPLRAILHLAGATPATAGPAELTAANVDLAERVLNAAQCRVFMLSSAAVYGRPEPDQQPFHEGDTLAPLSPYGESKAAMEYRALARQNPNTCILRLGNVAGADALLGQLIKDRNATIELDIFPDGHGPRRAYVGPQQLLRIILRLCDAPSVPPVLNIATPDAVNMDDLLDAWMTCQPGAGAFTPRAPGTQAIQSVCFNTAALQRIVPFDAQASRAATIAQDLFELAHDQTSL